MQRLGDDEVILPFFLPGNTHIPPLPASPVHSRSPAVAATAFAHRARPAPPRAVALRRAGEHGTAVGAEPERERS